MSHMKQKQYEVRVTEFDTYKLPQIPEPYFWKLWCNGSNVAFLELRKKGRFFSTIIKGSSIIAGDLASTVEMLEETAYYMMKEYLDIHERED